MIRTTITDSFAQVKDPRKQHAPPHLLIDIITIALCAVIGGANDWVAVEKFGRAKAGWLRQFLRLPHGIPSHDTFGTVFAAIEPSEFEHGFIQWTQRVSQISRGEIVPIDGKSVRRSHDRSEGQAALHLISAWASQNQLILGQLKVADKSNEITAIPKLLELLDLTGAIVTIDAMGCQTEIAQQIVAQEADYVLALKDNQGKLFREVRRLFHDARTEPASPIPYEQAQTVEKNHGRLETRRCLTINEPAYIAYLNPQGKWTNLQSIAMVEAQRRIGEEVTTETRYYLSSLSGQAAHLNHVIRTHWQIENQVHWVLDVSFREDDSRIRKGHGPQNFAFLRRMALNLLKRDTSESCGIQNKRLKAGWDDAYLAKILANLS